MSASNETEKLLLEDRKVKALERIALSIDTLSIWFEEVDKEEWGERIQFYLSEFLTSAAPVDSTAEVEKDE
tara:strand:- start:14169 stop:14381 length:213 start_codon:yes stop_codon:yes gene_type:complete